MKSVRSTRRHTINKEEAATHRWGKPIYVDRGKEYKQTKRHIFKEKRTCTHIHTLQ